MNWLAVIHHPDQLLLIAAPYAEKVVTAILVFLFGRWLVNGLVRLTNRLMSRAKIESTLIKFVGRLVFILGMSIVVIAAISQLGVDMTSAAAVLGGAAIAVGLSLQNQLSSFAAGVLLILFRPILVGEWVDIGGKSGSVAEINVFYTTLTSFGNQVIVLPNNQVWNNAIINYARNGWRRIDLTISVAYSTDLRKAKQILVDILQSDQRILADPPATVAVKALGESSIDFAVRMCANNTDWWNLQCDTLERIKLQFDAENIEIPFPQQDVRIRELPSTAPSSWNEAHGNGSPPQNPESKRPAA